MHGREPSRACTPGHKVRATRGRAYKDDRERTQSQGKGQYVNATNGQNVALRVRAWEREQPGSKGTEAGAQRSKRIGQGKGAGHIAGVERKAKKGKKKHRRKEAPRGGVGSRSAGGVGSE